MSIFFWYYCYCCNKYVETFKFKDAKWCDDVDCSTCTIPYRNICIKLGLIFTLMKNRSLWIWNPQFLNRIRRSSYPIIVRKQVNFKFSLGFKSVVFDFLKPVVNRYHFFSAASQQFQKEKHNDQMMLFRTNLPHRTSN